MQAAAEPRPSTNLLDGGVAGRPQEVGCRAWKERGAGPETLSARVEMMRFFFVFPVIYPNLTSAALT